MATTTPNFGWAVPTSTDLVKDGAVAIETLGDSIDASLVDLKGGTTGQVLKKNSNTDMDFVWSADSAGMTNPMTTTGDTIYSSSGSTPARLGIGSTGQVLTVAGGVPSWATPSSGSPTFTGASVYRASPDQAIATATYTAINWTAENYDTDAFHDNSTNNTRLTIPTGKGGYYNVNSQIGIQGNTATEWTLRVSKNGSPFRYMINTGQTNDSSITLNFTTNLVATDYLTVEVYQNSGTSKNLFAGAFYCWFECTLVGA